jgi:hypothetical protein
MTDESEMINKEAVSINNIREAKYAVRNLLYVRTGGVSNNRYFTFKIKHKKKSAMKLNKAQAFHKCSVKCAGSVIM